jgi:hypothetical protein
VLVEFYLATRIDLLNVFPHGVDVDLHGGDDVARRLFAQLARGKPNRNFRLR